MSQAKNLEDEFCEPGSGFQVFDPYKEENKNKKLNAPFLKRRKHHRRDCVVQRSIVSEVVLTVAALRSLDKSDFKPTEFHRLWLSGFVDRHGRGTRDLKKAILKQALPFEGEPKIGDAEILKIVDDARDAWIPMVIRKKGWAAFFLAASLFKAGWFDEDGLLSDGAIAFYGKSQIAIATRLAKSMTPMHMHVLTELSKSGKQTQIKFLNNNSRASEWDLTRDIIAWCHANKLIDSNWFPTLLGKRVLDLCAPVSKAEGFQCS